MRSKLASIRNNERHRFVGIYTRCGYKSYRDRFSPTLLLKNVRDSEGNIVTDHLWFNYTKGFLKLGLLKDGDEIAFNARVDSYVKGYYGSESIDYKLSYPTKIELLNDTDLRLPMPIDDKYALIGFIMKENKNFYLENGRPYEKWYVDAFDTWKKDHWN